MTARLRIVACILAIGFAYVAICAVMLGPATVENWLGGSTPATAAVAEVEPLPTITATPGPSVTRTTIPTTSVKAATKQNDSYRVATTTRTGTLPASPKAHASKVIPARDSSTEARVSIPSIGIDRAVEVGAQRTIDRGYVTHYTGWPSTFVQAGQPGVYWLAAHNYGSYGPFHPLLRLKVGKDIVVTTRTGARYTYRVVGRAVVMPRVPESVVWGEWGPESGPARAVLQTCIGDKRLLVYADLVPN